MANPERQSSPPQRELPKTSPDRFAFRLNEKDQKWVDQRIEQLVEEEALKRAQELVPDLTIADQDELAQLVGELTRENAKKTAGEEYDAEKIERIEKATTKPLNDMELWGEIILAIRDELSQDPARQETLREQAIHDLIEQRKQNADKEEQNKEAARIQAERDRAEQEEIIAQQILERAEKDATEAKRRLYTVRDTIQDIKKEPSIFEQLANTPVNTPEPPKKPGEENSPAIHNIRDFDTPRKSTDSGLFEKFKSLFK